MESGLIDDSVLRKQEEALNALDRDPFKDYKFPCLYCDKKFPTDFVLDYHLKLIHKGNCYITYQYLTIYINAFFSFMDTVYVIHWCKGPFVYYISIKVHLVGQQKVMPGQKAIEIQI